MTPAEYVEKVPRFTAVQWDGTDEAATWIVETYPGATRDGEDIVVLDSMDRRQPLQRDVWVLLDPATGMVVLQDDALFQARYQAA